jgi:hypothetical protein
VTGSAKKHRGAAAKRYDKTQRKINNNNTNNNNYGVFEVILTAYSAMDLLINDVCCLKMAF